MIWGDLIILSIFKFLIWIYYGTGARWLRDVFEVACFEDTSLLDLSAGFGHPSVEKSLITSSGLEALVSLSSSHIQISFSVSISHVSLILALFVTYSWRFLRLNGPSLFPILNRSWYFSDNDYIFLEGKTIADYIKYWSSHG